MEKNFTHIPHILISSLALAASLAVIVMVARPVNGQSGSTACTGPMIRSFGSCIGFLTSGSNLSRPSSSCCSTLRDLMGNGQDCLCLIVTGGVPFEVPINRNLAMSLPSACRMSGVPIECKATATPVPTPGSPGSPGQGGPSTNPGLSPPSSTGPFVPQPFTPPSSIPGGGMMPPVMPGDNAVPTLTPPGMRPTLDPSAAHPMCHNRVLPISLLVFVVRDIVLKYY